MCNLCVIWQYHPHDMHIHLHTISLIGVTGLGTVIFILCQIGVDFTGRFLGGYCCVEKHFRRKFKVGLKVICAEFQFFFQHLPDMILPFYFLSISNQNGSLTSYLFMPTILYQYWSTLNLCNVCYDTLWALWHGSQRLKSGAILKQYGSDIYIYILQLIQLIMIE